jgi:Transposase DDE domain.
LLSERITDTAVQKRLTACAPWLKMILEQMWFAGISQLPGNLRLIVIDGSSLSVPGAAGTSYRLHIAIDLVRLSIVHIEVTDQHVGESLTHYPLLEGDILVVDRGYNLPQEIIDLSAEGKLVTVRLNPNSMRLFSVGGEQKINVLDELKKAQTDELCFPVWIANKTGEYAEGWVHARRLPEVLRAEARRKCRQNSKSKNIKEATLMYAEWQMILTTVPPEALDTATVIALYGLRWQVELFIKRLKSLLDIDKLRCAEGSKLNEVWLYGKLLFTTLLMKRTDEKFSVGGIEPEKSRDATPWRFWKTIRNEMKSILLGAMFWKTEQFPAAEKVMKERPRKRKLQSLPPQVEKLLLTFG